MTGFELILTAALCLTCTTKPEGPLPSGLVLLEGQENIRGSSVAAGSSGGTATSVMPNGDDAAIDKLDTTLENAPEETLVTIRAKYESLRALRNYVNGRHFRIATIEDYPLSYTEELANGTILGKGVSFEVIDFLRDKFNFTYEVVKPASNIIGSTDDFKNSLVEMLNNSDADMAAAFIPLLSDPRSYIYYSTTTLDEGEWIMVMQRPRESATGSGLLAPFDFWVWILIFISLLAVGPIIYVLIILRNRLTGDTDQKPYSLGHCAWFVYGALMKQGSTLSPIADSTRLLFATWWIFITILTSFYTANLTAFLTLSKFTLPFNTVNDILYKQKQFVTQRGGGVEYAIRGTNESLSKLSIMVTSNHAVFTEFHNDSLTLQNFVEQRGHVYVRDRPAINHVLYLDYRYRKTISMDDEKIHCPFAMAKEPFLKKKRAFAYPLGSNLSLLFDPELLNLVESGIIKHLSAKGLPNAEICPQDLGGTERQLRNGDLLMTYYIMLAGFATSIVVFSTELIFRFLNHRNDNNQWARHGIGRTPNGHSVIPSRWTRRFLDATNDKQNLSQYGNSNVTPPPPYQSIFNSNNGKKNIFSGNNNKSIDNNLSRWRQAAGMAVGVGAIVGGGAARVGLNARQLPHGNANDGNGVRRVINGRDYLVYRQPNGQNQLVPMRVPSAALFQYTYTE